VEKAIECGFTHVNVLAHEIDGSVGMRQLALDTL
jgi:histidinol-phosphatase (PHP family)